MTINSWLIILSVITTALSIIFFVNYNYYRSQIKQRGSFGEWPIKLISLPDVDPIFHVNEFGPTQDTQVQFIGRGHLIVPGGTSDAEAWVLAVLAKKAKTIFEFGTCTGKTSYLMALNSPADSEVITLTLPPDQVNHYTVDSEDSKSATRNALNESSFTRFLYTGTPVEKKITQLFGDSKHFDTAPYEKKVDLIFVDGSHALSYVFSDSEKAFRMVKDGGLILWHDYRGPSTNKDVYKALNTISKEKQLYHIEGTSFIVFRKG
ncbi:MAG TPA: class I SAM-dependent methyltransferase [Cyclobacteriaceae bacterium]|nr:class I SAM-dependent methyltransferase [Cyclobacteriaceae bacterium]